MPKTVLIVLAAVVALIVIVVLTGMRYLRTDDEDDFDDDAPAEHGRSRGYPAADQPRPRQRHVDDRADERVGAGRGGAGPAPGRGEPSADRYSADRYSADRRGPDQRGPGRRVDDRSWREDTGRNGGSVPAVREQRPARGGPRDRDISEPLTAVARTSRSVPARGTSRGDDYDSQPVRRAPDYGRDGRERRDRRDSRGSRDSRDSRDFRLAGMDDYAAPSDSREPRDSRDRRDRGDGRGSRDRTDLRDSRPAASNRDDADRDGRDRRSSTRPNARPGDDLLPAVKPRQSRGKRDSEGDWPSNEWDELSDVDFWAELASDKPFNANETAEPTRTERRVPRAGRDAAPDRDARPERSARPDRGARQGSRIGSDLSDPVTKQLSRHGRELDSGILPAARHRDLPADRSSAARAADPRPTIADDDPLTSPSFPRIAADDSRSYRRTRPAAADSRHGNGRSQADPPSYPGIPRVEPVRGLDGASATGGHSLPAASGAELTDGYGPAAGYPAADAAQAGDPYGVPPAASSAPATYSLPQASSYPSDGATESYSVPAHSGSYQVPELAPYGGSGGYHAAASHPVDPITNGYQNGSGADGYLPSARGGNGFAAETSAGSYHSAPPDPEPYRSDLGAGSYQATSSYSLPPAPPGYGSSPDDRAADYPVPGYQPDGYQGYGAATSGSGPHQRPEPGYRDGGYSGGAEPALPASLPAAQPDLGYPVYPAPVPTGQNGYGTAAPQVPGYGTAPQQGGGYDPAGYPLPAREANGYAGADPYAVDPYGQQGYGGTGY